MHTLSRQVTQCSAGAIRISAVLLILLAASGCTSQIKSKVCLPTAECGAAGMSYFLPKRMAKLVVERSKVNPKEAEAAFSAAKAAADAAKKVADDAEATAKHKQAIADQANTPATIEAAKVAAAEATLAKANSLAAQTKLLQAQEALQLAQSGAKFIDKIELSLLPMMADTSRTFVAELHHQPLVDDDVKLHTSEDGLLQSADAIYTDRTGDVLTEVAKTAAGIAKMMAGIPPFAPSSPLKNSHSLRAI